MKDLQMTVSLSTTDLLVSPEAMKMIKKWASEEALKDNVIEGDADTWRRFISQTAED